MSVVTTIIVARILHVVSSTVWAGFVIIAGLVLVTASGDRPGEDARRLRQRAIGRASGTIAAAAVVSLLSGLFLYANLHAGAHTPTEIALGIGAASAVLSFLVGAIGSRRPERELARLDSRGANSPGEIRQIEALNRRVIFIGRLTAALLLVSAGAMTAARFL